MVDPSTFFQHGRVPCKKCGQMNDFGSSEALYYADLSTPCAHCGFRFLEHMDRQMHKLMEMADKDPEWGKYNIVVRRASDGEMVIEKRPIAPMPDELKSVIEEMK